MKSKRFSPHLEEDDLKSQNPVHNSGNQLQHGSMISLCGNKSITVKNLIKDYFLFLFHINHDNILGMEHHKLMEVAFSYLNLNHNNKRNHNQNNKKKKKMRIVVFLEQ